MRTMIGTRGIRVRMRGIGVGMLGMWGMQGIRVGMLGMWQMQGIRVGMQYFTTVFCLPSG